MLFQICTVQSKGQERGPGGIVTRPIIVSGNFGQSIILLLRGIEYSHSSIPSC